MAKVYECDSCGEVIKDVRKARMKEFFVGVTWDGIEEKAKHRVKIHLCNECFKGLKKIGRDVGLHRKSVKRSEE